MIMFSYFAWTVIYTVMEETSIISALSQFLPGENVDIVVSM